MNYYPLLLFEDKLENIENELILIPNSWLIFLIKLLVS